VSGGYLWSPDSSKLATTVNGSLIVLGKDGSVVSAPLRDIGIAMTNAVPAVVNAWTGPSELALAVPEAGVRINFSVTLANQRATASRLPAMTQVPNHPGNQPPSADAAAAVQGLTRASQVTRSKPTVNGLGDLFEARNPSPTNREPTIRIVVRERSTGATFEVTDVPSASRSGRLYDATIIPG
jgi:hypothetical protein